MTQPTTNPISFRVPPNLRGKIHPDAEQAIHDHDNAIVDLQQANSTVAGQIQALQAQLAAMGKK